METARLQKKFDHHAASIQEVCSYATAFTSATEVIWLCQKHMKTSQSEELSSPSRATIIICLSSDVMSSIMALEQT
jgi:hypothetical protein